MRESCETAESAEVRRSPQRSSDVFQRCSNRSREVCGPPPPVLAFHAKQRCTTKTGSEGLNRCGPRHRGGFDYVLAMAGVAFVDGEYVPIEQARIPILDWGFLRSDATYDVVHVWRGSFFRLEDHLDRFERSMEHLRLSPPYDRSEIRDFLIECVRLSGLRDAYAEVICTRGIPKPGSREPRDCENRFYAFVVQFIWIADPEKQERGLHAVIGSKQRIAPESVDPTVKNYHWLDLETGLLESYEQGGETVILVDAEDNVVEGPGFNVFAVANCTISTPDRGVLEGITRKTIIELAAEHGIQLAARTVPADELRQADEVFLSSTAGGVIPGTKVGRGAPGDREPGL